MKNLLLFFTALFFVYQPVSAQNHWYTKGAINFEERILLVGLRVEDPEVIKKFGKKEVEELAAYKKAITDFNHNIQKAMESVWTLNAKVEFKTMAEIQKIVFDPKLKTKYAFITHVNPNSRLYNDRDGTAMSNLDIVVGEMIEKPVTTVLMPYVNPTLGELIFGLQQLHAQMEGIIRFKGEFPESIRPEYLSNYKAPRIKEMTLLIDTSTLQEKFDLSKVSESYIYPIKFVDKSEIENAIIERKKGVAYLLSMPANNSLSGSLGDAKQAYLTFVHQITNAENGELLLYEGPANSPDYVYKFGEISLKQLEYFAKTINPVVKNK